MTPLRTGPSRHERSAGNWAHNCGTHGAVRPARRRVSTALGCRSMVRMGPVVRAPEDHPRSPPTSRHLTSPLTVWSDQRRCWCAWRSPPTRSHGGSQGFKSPHLHPTTQQVRASPVPHRRARGRSWDRLGHTGATAGVLAQPNPGALGVAGRRRRACPGDRGARCRPRAQVAVQVPDRGAAQGGGTGGSPGVRRVRRPSRADAYQLMAAGLKGCRGRWPGVRVACWGLGRRRL
jgi:hypothetical protein